MKRYKFETIPLKDLGAGINHVIIDDVLWRYIMIGKTFLHSHTYYVFKRINSSGEIETMRLMQTENQDKKIQILVVDYDKK